MSLTDKKPKYSLLEAKTRLEAYCAYQERCAQEVELKLKSWQIYSEDIDILLADLISNNFLNEERFAESYISGKFRIKNWGKTKIKAHLKSKRISDYSINKGFKIITDEDYLETIHKIAVKKWRIIKGKSKWDKIAKLKRYLYSKGYESELLNEIVNTYLE